MEICAHIWDKAKAAWRNVQNAPDAVTASTDQSPVIVLDAEHGIN